MIDAEKKDYSLHELLVAMKISKSSYFYQESAFKKPDKYTAVRKTLASIFNDNYQCYGYRRLYSEVRKQGLCLSEKVIRRLMKEEGLQVKCKRRRKYSSYKGEISPEVPNRVQEKVRALERPFSPGSNMTAAEPEVTPSVLVLQNQRDVSVREH